VDVRRPLRDDDGVTRPQVERLGVAIDDVPLNRSVSTLLPRLSGAAPDVLGVREFLNPPAIASAWRIVVGPCSAIVPGCHFAHHDRDAASTTMTVTVDGDFPSATR
jgi:hypothetical protein